METVSPCIRIDDKIAEKLQTIGLYFGWQAKTPQPVTALDRPRNLRWNKQGGKTEERVKP